MGRIIVRGVNVVINYDEYMQSPEWDKKRKQRLAIDNYTCKGCGVTGKPLDVHHRDYSSFGDEKMEHLESLCRSCHDLEHPKEAVYIDVCQTCKERLIIIRNWLADGWTRWLCLSGHIVEKKGKHR